jgi:hypothetical protein
LEKDVADKKPGEKAISWADMVKKQRDEDAHSFYETLSLTIELINW